VNGFFGMGISALHGYLNGLLGAQIKVKKTRVENKGRNAIFKTEMGIPKQFPFPLLIHV